MLGAPLADGPVETSVDRHTLHYLQQPEDFYHKIFILSILFPVAHELSSTLHQTHIYPFICL